LNNVKLFLLATSDPSGDLLFCIYEQNKTKVASNEVQQTVLHKSCSHFIPTCEGSVQVEKRVWSFSRRVRFGVLSQKQTTSLALGLFSRGTSQIERLFFLFLDLCDENAPFSPLPSGSAFDGS
jgi:hypothetical protein